jgi:peptide/nickel transport system permease protein
MVSVTTRVPARAFTWGRRLPHEVQVGTIIVAIVAAASLLAPLIAPYDPNEVDILNSLEAPSRAHWMGTDDVGRDVFSRALYGTRADLLVVLAVTIIGFTFGTLVGTLAGYYGRRVDMAVSRTGDLVVSVPFLLVILTVVAILGVGTFSVCVGIVLVDWAFYSRLARTEMLALREQEFILASRSLGYTNKRIILRHVLPNAVQPGLIFATIDSISSLVALAAMSYLGFGAQPPAADLGSIIAGGQPFLLSAWWISTLPALLLVFLGVGIGLVGDGLTGREYDGAVR